MNDLFFLFLILSSFSPVIKQQILEARRAQTMRRLEKRRASRVISMIHRQETVSLLGIGIHRYISIEDAEEVLRAIRLTDPERPIDLILHTPGGLVLAAEQIAWALAEHPARVTVFVPHYAMSGGTLLALAADEVVMDRNAALGPVDPQLGRQAAASIVAAVERKHPNHVGDETLILADTARKALAQVEHTVRRLLERKMDAGPAARAARALATGVWTHDHILRVEDARALGLKVSTEMPPEIYSLMALYPQPTRMRPSVEYVPAPYRSSPPGSSQKNAV
ncbi:SDH family Clp fold serine proteinase [Rhodocaloribacter sp.]|jgi:ClpP class serine protease